MDSALIDQTSETFLGQWKRLVSTTNWEKGQIIFEWREALRDSGAPAIEFSDDAWARRVGNVPPQHVGRLRRAYERFAATRDEYPGLFWSHFQAALDWDDPELWLEGAVQSSWSISEMRQKRWEANGGVANEELPLDEAPPWDEDAEPSGEILSATMEKVQTPQGARAGHESDATDSDEYSDSEDGDADPNSQSSYSDATGSTASPPVRPFASLPPLPVDVSDAFESYKLCILRHKVAGWQEISRDDMLASLDALKQLALAPAED